MPTVKRESPSVCHRLTECARGRQMEFYVIEDGGHAWPGAEPIVPGAQSGPSADDVILDFFDGVQRRG